MAAVHRGEAQVTTWSYERQRLGDHRLLPGRHGHAAATVSRLSPPDPVSGPILGRAAHWVPQAFTGVHPKRH